MTKIDRRILKTQEALKKAVIELPQYDSVFSRMLAYSQDFTLVRFTERLLEQPG